MTDNLHEELRTHGRDVLPSDNALQPGIIADFNVVRGKILALARALAREDAAEEEKAERARNRRDAAIDALDEVPGPDTPNLDSNLSIRKEASDDGRG